jgi:ATP-dependent helicase/nuclease subunit B
LDRPAAVKSLGPPQPAPPVSARPRKLSATRIETWVRDPYGIYAQYVLGLRALDTLDADPGAAERGIIVHQVLDEFVRQFPKELPPDGLERLIGMGKQAFGKILERPGVWAFWWPRFERIAQWFVAHEAQRRLEATVVGSEVRGQLEIPVLGGSFIVSAIADRIERQKDGNLVIVDYKTGSVPQNEDLKQGFSPQLPIEAVLAEAGGFEGVARGTVSQLAVWRVSGAGDGGGVQAYNKLDVPETVEKTRAGLVRLIAAFDDPSMPYRSRPRPDHQPRFSDYDHLARVKEWLAGGGGE